MKNPWDEIGTPEQDILSRRVSSSHPLNLFWGKDSYSRFLFIYEFESPRHLPDRYPDLKGIHVRLLSPEKADAEKYMLVLILREKNDWPIFYSLCTDIITATSSLEKKNQATLIILRRLQRWQKFLQNAKSELLPERVIKGLIGELLFLLNHIEPYRGIGLAVQFWQGPDDMPQDFNVEDCAIEVKCQLGTTTPCVKISSADQLCTQLPDMFLYVVTLGKTDPEAEDAINLPCLINRIRSMLEVESPDDLEHFNNLLYQSGYIDLEDYEKFSYISVAEKMYKVEEAFPRICTDQLPSGIEKISYDISLIECEDYISSPDWIDL